MPTPKLDPAIHREIFAMNAAGCSELQIVEALGVGKGTVRNYKDKPPVEDAIDKYAKFHKERFDELLARYQLWVGDTRAIKVPKKKQGKRIKALCLNDIHAPFHNEAAFLRAVKDNKDADECWVAGDVLDLYGVSRYPKTRVPFSMVQEFQSGQAVMRTLAETFPVVRVLEGNHDERWIKFLVNKNIPPEVLEFMRFAYEDSLSPLAKICAAYPNVKMMESKRIDYARYGFIHQIGDCVLSHAEKYSSIPGKTPADVLDRIKKKLEPMGVVKNFKVLAQAHTHAAGKVWGDYGVVTLEMGCLSLTPDYDGNPRMMGRMPITGYTIFHQEDGVTDINASNFIQLT